MKNSQEWKHLKSSSGNFAHSCCARNPLLLRVPTLHFHSKLQMWQHLAVLYYHRSTPRLWEPSRVKSGPENSKKRLAIWTATQIFPTLCRSKQPNSDFGFVVKDNYYAASQVVPGCPYFILIIETIFPAFFRVIILKVGSLTSGTGWPPQCYTVPKTMEYRTDGSAPRLQDGDFAHEANSDTREGKAQGLWVWNDFKVIIQQK